MEYRTMSILQKTIKVHNNYVGVHARNSISNGKHSIVVLRYSYFSISTTDE